LFEGIKQALKDRWNMAKAITARHFGTDSRGQLNLATTAISVLVFVIVLVIYTEVYANLNTDNLSTSAQNLLNMVPFLLVAAAVIGIVAGAFLIFKRR